MARADTGSASDERSPGAFPATGRSVFSSKQWESLAFHCGLTARELDVVECVFDGASEREMATRLGLSPHTVHTRLRRVYRKLAVRRREGLMVRIVAAWISLGGDRESVE